MRSHLSKTLPAACLGLCAIAEAGTIMSCPANSPVSCSSSSVSNTCCTNSPGGLLLQTQFWDYNPSTGPSTAWTIHGLWPDNCDGTYQANCDTSRAYTNITAILQSEGRTALLSYMATYWPDYQGNNEQFWEHEWGKHGTCISTLDPPCYTNYQPTQEVGDFFNRTVSLYQGLDSYTFLKNAGIVPKASGTYALSAVQAALTNAFGYAVTIQCDSNNAINEIWYYHHTVGSVTSGTFIPTAATTAGDCPATVSYIPKSGGGGGTSPSSSSTKTTATSTGSGPTSTPTGTFSGKGYLNVAQTGGSTNGCLISAGTWYTTGTCATYTATPSGSGFTLSSSKGQCAVSSGGAITCSSSVSSATVFGSSGSSLTYGGSSHFYANAVASGSTQQPVYPGDGSVDLTITWSPQ